MAILVVRVILLYFLTLLAMKAMGKRELGQLQPFELVVLLIISEMASVAMQSTAMTLANSLIPIITIATLQITLSIINLKSEKSRALICGRPVQLISNGQLDEQAMAKLRINLNDLQEMARSQGYFDLSAIENAVMETNGQLSLMPNTLHRNLQYGDIYDQPENERMGELLILDGHVNQRSLMVSGKDEAWLIKQLNSAGIDDPKQVFVAGISEDGRFFYQKKIKG